MDYSRARALRDAIERVVPKNYEWRDNMGHFFQVQEHSHWLMWHKRERVLPWDPMEIDEDYLLESAYASLPDEYKALIAFAF